MSDFAQAGSICTLQRLTEGYGAVLEAELVAAAAKRPIALILPCHGGDLRSPSLRQICGELQSAPWLEEILISINGAEAADLHAARELFAPCPQRVRFLWNDHAGARAALSRLLEEPPESLPSGKGLNVWAALGALSAEGRAVIAVTQDCDVTSFRREALVRLCAPLLHPELSFHVAKMYYSRVTDRLYGRVSRLFLAPLLQAALRVAGHLPLLDFLLAFRYPLAGECALRLSLAQELPLAPGWGLETALLGEIFRHTEPSAVCQVDGGSGYDHRHRPAIDGQGGLAAMCGEIASTLLAQLAAEGVEISPNFRGALRAAYRKEAAQALRRSEALALMNGLPFDREDEAAIVESFALRLRETPGALRAPLSLPAWSPLWRERRAAAVDFLEQASEPLHSRPTD